MTSMKEQLGKDLSMEDICNAAVSNTETVFDVTLNRITPDGLLRLFGPATQQEKEAV